MIKKASDRIKNEVPNARGGEGAIFMEKLLEGSELLNSSKLFNIVTVPAGCSIGYHQHLGDNEAYFVTEGTALYNDNGTEIQLSKGDIAYCGPNEWHGIVNNSNEVFSMIALVLNDNNA